MGGPDYGGVALRAVRDFFVFLVLWLFLAALTAAMTVGPQKIGLVSIAGGVGAGLNILLRRDRWIPLWVSAFVISLAFYLYLDLPLWLGVIRAGADVGAAITYALIVIKFRRQSSPLGADIKWVLTALAAAVGIRGIALIIQVIYDASITEEPSRVAWLEYFVGTMTGYVAGSALVLGLALWRPAYRACADKREFVAGTIGAVGLVALVLFTPFGEVVPGAVFLLVPLLLFTSVRAPSSVTAVLTGVAVLCAAIAATQSTGPFTALDVDDPEAVLGVQVGMFVLATSIFMLSATVGERQAAQQDALRAMAGMRTMFAASPVASAWVTVTDRQPIQIWTANPAFLGLFGTEVATIRGMRLSELFIDPVSSERIVIEEGRDFRSRSAEGNVWLRPMLSDEMHVDPNADPAMAVVDWDERVPFTADHTLASAVLTLEDVTTARVSEDLLRQQMRRDNLTGLPNRVVLVERLEEALGRRHPGARLGLVVVDIDGMKVLNDSRGHSVGDQVIIQIGRRLEALLEPGDSIIRVGGDEFSIIASRPLGAESVAALAERVVAAVRDPVVVDGEPINVTVSAGAVEATEEQITPADLLRHADVALVRAESEGRDRAATFARQDDTGALDRLGIADRLRTALSRDDLVLLFQPIILVATGAVTSAEALVRLREPDGGYTSPDQFLPFAAEVGLMGTITEQVLDKACAAAHEWESTGTAVRVAFNAPPRWLSGDAVRYIEACMSKHAVPWEYMTLEVTEEDTLDLGSDIIDALNSLRGRGMHIAIDDFGTGYAGLDSFRSIPADIVKIDRSFVVDMFRTAQDREFVRSMIDLVHRFGKLALAEGVETLDQFEALRQMGCDYAQGFLFSKPVEFTDFPAGQVLDAAGVAAAAPATSA